MHFALTLSRFPHRQLLAVDPGWSGLLKHSLACVEIPFNLKSWGWGGLMLPLVITESELCAMQGQIWQVNTLAGPLPLLVESFPSFGRSEDLQGHLTTHRSTVHVFLCDAVGYTARKVA